MQNSVCSHELMGSVFINSAATPKASFIFNKWDVIYDFL
jgi:hypothetical protein